MTNVTPLKLQRLETGEPAYIVSTACRIHPVRWSRLENGRKVPTARELERICEYFGVTASEVFPDLVQEASA